MGKKYTFYAFFVKGKSTGSHGLKGQLFMFTWQKHRLAAKLSEYCNSAIWAVFITTQSMKTKWKIQMYGISFIQVNDIDRVL